jgi:hypothetical protein
MNEQTCGQQSPEVLLDAKVVAAFSSLTTFSCEFSNGKGLVIEAVGEEGTSAVQAKVVEASELPREADAVCKVDWSWIYGSALTRFVTTSGAARLELKDIGPLTIAAQVWQGKPFLSFQPFRAAK